MSNTQECAPPKFETWCHVEIPSDDPEKAQAFYSAVFDWKFQSAPEMPYTVYTTPNGSGGGIMKRPECMAPGLVNYVFVEAIEPYLEKIESNGGKVVHPITEVPNTGWFAIVTDPDGNPFGLWRHNPDAHPH
jgi:predicted enzyme related to lactoylglutathione lyase